MLEIPIDVDYYHVGLFLSGSLRLSDIPFDSDLLGASIPNTDRSAGDKVPRSVVYVRNALLSF